MPFATTQEYIDALAPDRKDAVSKLREVIRRRIQPGFEEGIQYGMIGFYVPHSIYPAGYHCDKKQPVPFCHVASQKNHISFYAFCIYGNAEVEEWLRTEYAKTGFKIDMGKGCIRFKKMDQIPFELIGELVAQVSLQDFLSNYEANIGHRAK